MYQKHYEYALAHPEEDVCKRLLELAQLYAAQADIPTLGLIQGAAKDVEVLMKKGS